MIIELLAFVAVQDVDAPIRTETMTFTSPAYPYELRNEVGKYQGCLLPLERDAYDPDVPMRAIHQADVERCEAVKSEMISAATEIWSEQVARSEAREFVEELFHALSASHVEMGAQLDAFTSGHVADEGAIPND